MPYANLKKNFRRGKMPTTSQSVYKKMPVAGSCRHIAAPIVETRAAIVKNEIPPEVSCQTSGGTSFFNTATTITFIL